MLGLDPSIQAVPSVAGMDPKLKAWDDGGWGDVPAKLDVGAGESIRQERPGSAKR